MIRLTVLLSLIFLAFCSTAPTADSEIQPPLLPKRELKKDIPNDSWVKTFFDGYKIEIHEKGNNVREEKRGGLDEFAVENGVSILREDVLPENNLEVRVWVGFGLYGNDGFILRRSSENWSAVFLKKMICHDFKTHGKYDLPPPKSGWDALWQKLVEADILILPDSSKLKYPDGVIDGKSYVVETNSDFLYRTYHYGNPDFVKLKEARQMVKIGQIVADEFDLESFSSKTGGCGKDK